MTSVLELGPEHPPGGGDEVMGLLEVSSLKKGMRR